MTELARGAHAMGRPLIAALLIAAFDVGYFAARGAGRFLSQSEWIAYGATALALIASDCVFLWAVGSAIVRMAGASSDQSLRSDLRNRARRVVGWMAGVWLIPLLAGAGWALTSGRTMRSLPARPWGVLVASILGAALFGWIIARVAVVIGERRLGGARLLTLFFAIVSVACMVLEPITLSRLYPVFSAGIAVFAIASGVLAAAVWVSRGDAAENASAAEQSFDEPPSSVGWRTALVVVGLLAFPCAAFLLHMLRVTPNVDQIERESSITGNAVRAVRMLAPDTLLDRSRDSAPLAPSGHVGTRASIDLRGKDVLLITVDALRADRLRCCGGRGLTPQMDSLARSSTVFHKAYTPAPHTSYALASLFAGKHVRPVMELAKSVQNHATIAELLRRAGYATAAFYPPSVFFVDPTRFATFRRDTFGFEHRQESFSSGTERVNQLETYLRSRGNDRRPMFVWAHLFEPHAPYEPPPSLATSTSEEGRYDGEVRAADAAVGALVAAFRKSHPDATVIVTSDHGEEFGEHGGFFHGTTLYEEQVHVPLIWSSPGLNPQTVERPVEILDVATTLLAALGIPRDARMTGDDLGPLLRGASDVGPEFAFAFGPEERMATDGRYKAICAIGEDACRLYDLSSDPGEKRNIAVSKPDVARALREALVGCLASIAGVETRAARNANAWPEALARASLGDASVSSELVPLLAHEKPEVRAAAARGLGELGYAQGLPALARIRDSDSDAAVRAEAAIASLRLGDRTAGARVRTIVQQSREVSPTPSPTTPTHTVEGADLAAQAKSRARRAAFALAAIRDQAGVPELLDLARDQSADVDGRRHAIEALGALRAQSAVSTLVRLLPDIQLRVAAAEALGRIGDRSAIRALSDALAEEPYLPAQTAEVRALGQLGAHASLPKLWRLLSQEEPPRSLVGALLDLGALQISGSHGGDLRRSALLRAGTWSCDEVGCVPGENATLELPLTGAPSAHSRLHVLINAPAGGEVLRVGTTSFELRQGPQELMLPIDQRGRIRLPVSVRGVPRLVALAVSFPR